MKYILEFEAPDDWKPMGNGCWSGCPVSILTPLGQKCRAKDCYDKHQIVICPVITMRKQQIIQTHQQEEVSCLKKS